MDVSVLIVWRVGLGAHRYGRIIALSLCKSRGSLIFRPFGGFLFRFVPTAYAVGCILSPLRGYMKGVG